MNQTTHPDAIGRLVAAPALAALAAQLTEANALSVAGLWGSSVAAVIAGIEQQLHRPILLICGHIDEAEDLADDLELFTRRRPPILPALELAGSLGRVSEEQVSNRLRLVRRLADQAQAAPPILITSIQALMQSVPSRRQISELMLTLTPEQALEAEKLIVWLAEHGFNRLDQVEVPGDFAVRGGIIDIYLPGEFEQAVDLVGLTVRVDFFGDQIESIRRFDLESLGSGETLPGITLPDIKGQLPDASESTHLMSYLPAGYGGGVVGAAGDRGAGAELSGSVAGSAGDLSAVGAAEPCGGVYARGTVAIRSVGGGDSQPCGQADTACDAADPVVAAV
jgi:transcription-repair coupling factor (superfamily II helicase)